MHADTGDPLCSVDEIALASQQKVRLQSLLNHQMASDSDTTPLLELPPPWKCKCTAYWMLFFGKGPLSKDSYAPLEAGSPAFSSSEEAGKFTGGLGMIQLVRYSETPAGKNRICHIERLYPLFVMSFAHILNIQGLMMNWYSFLVNLTHH
jgi:hypothetical protein